MILEYATIRGLTVWQPMAWCIEVGLKPIENRTYKPWVTDLAIHAGMRWHVDHARQLRELLKIDVPDPDDPQVAHGAIVAVAQVVDVITDEAGLDDRSLRWFSGPVGWRLSNVRRLRPIPCKGAQGLWRLPKDVYDQIVEQVQE